MHANCAGLRVDHNSNQYASTTTLQLAPKTAEIEQLTPSWPNVRRITLYNDIKLYSHNITVNTTISVQNAKILQLFGISFSSYEMYLLNIGFEAKIYATLIR